MMKRILYFVAGVATGAVAYHIIEKTDVVNKIKSHIPSKDKVVMIDRDDINEDRNTSEENIHKEETKSSIDEKEKVDTTKVDYSTIANNYISKEDADKIKESRSTNYVTSGDKVFAVNAVYESGPRVIPPEQFEEDPNYDSEVLYYHTNEILSDGYSKIENPEEIVGDALKHFGKYEDDRVIVVNDDEEKYYEIVKEVFDYE